ncbi:conserved protein of unknown function [Nitrospira japonica]|uniref:DUF2726 domain-containing protein n=1 Tax=Nitrospira japonica TaxID=1325564 RepID=A0A1W1I455_9BACT|nr:DUF2726 domain-containing protein [Nitrospira japonica]SLM47603.1 conserved protein of unknown function [Nitrospira japonica]
MDQVLFWSALVIGICAMWWFKASRKQTPTQTEERTLPTGVILEPQPLLSDRDVRLYNLLRMAAQDRYIILARVPLLGILRVQVEGSGRMQMLRRMALQHVDFVLIHPGCRLVEHVVQVEGDQELNARETEKRQDIRRIVHASGIHLVVLEADRFYSVRQLEEMLGLAGE